MRIQMQASPFFRSLDFFKKNYTYNLVFDNALHIAFFVYKVTNYAFFDSYASHYYRIELCGGGVFGGLFIFNFASSRSPLFRCPFMLKMAL